MPEKNTEGGGPLTFEPNSISGGNVLKGNMEMSFNQNNQLNQPAGHYSFSNKNPSVSFSDGKGDYVRTSFNVDAG